jgi:hypothetical protein
MRVYESIIHALRGLQSPERQGLQETILLLDSPRLRFPLSGVPVLPRYLVAASVKQCPVLRSCVSDLRSTESQQVYTLVADTPYPLSCSRSFCSSLLSSPPLTSTSVTVSWPHQDGPARRPAAMGHRNHGVNDSAGICLRLPSITFSVRKEPEAVVGRLDDTMVNGIYMPCYNDPD